MNLTDTMIINDYKESIARDEEQLAIDEHWSEGCTCQCLTDDSNKLQERMEAAKCRIIRFKAAVEMMIRKDRS